MSTIRTKDDLQNQDSGLFFPSMDSNPLPSLQADGMVGRKNKKHARLLFGLAILGGNENPERNSRLD